MKVVVCDKNWQEKWDEFVKINSSDFGLLQSWAWGEFQLDLGRKVWRLAIEEAGELLAVVQIIKQPLRFGKSYFYVPRGPIINVKIKNQNEKLWKFLFEEIEKLAKREKAIFVRIEPAWADIEINRQLLKDFKFFGQVQPKQTLILDLSKSEDELLAQMKQKTRYNIKVAQKHNITIDEGEKYFEDFWRLMEKTSVRDQFAPHAKDYYKRMLSVLGGGNEISNGSYQSPPYNGGVKRGLPAPTTPGPSSSVAQAMADTSGRRGTANHPLPAQVGELLLHRRYGYGGQVGKEGIKLVVAKDGDRVVVANLLVYFGSWAVYLHGASDYDYRDKMAPYLLQWHAIQQAKQNGLKFYDFWGTDEKKWPGVTRFKQGFSPETKLTDYVGAWDMPLSKIWYNIYRLLK